MEDVLLTKMAGIVFVSLDGGEQDVMSPWKLYVPTARTMKEVGGVEQNSCTAKKCKIIGFLIR